LRSFMFGAARQDRPWRLTDCFAGCTGGDLA
jgi:hypothetical protein